jgi:hypothetical protein
MKTVSAIGCSKKIWLQRLAAACYPDMQALLL